MNTRYQRSSLLSPIPPAAPVITTGSKREPTTVLPDNEFSKDEHFPSLLSSSDTLCRSKYKSDKSDDKNKGKYNSKSFALPPMTSGPSCASLYNLISDSEDFFLRYRVIESIGKGGHSIVFRVFDLEEAAKVMLQKTHNFPDKNIPHSSNSIKPLTPLVGSPFKSESFKASLYKAAKFIPLISSPPGSSAGGLNYERDLVTGYTADIRHSAGKEEDRILRLLTSHNWRQPSNNARSSCGEKDKESDVEYSSEVCPYIAAYHGTYLTPTHRIIVQELVEGGELYTEVANYHEQEEVLRQFEEAEMNALLLAVEEEKKKKISSYPLSSISITSPVQIEAAQQMDIAAGKQYIISTPNTTDVIWSPNLSALTPSNLKVGSLASSSSSLEKELVMNRKTAMAAITCRAEQRQQQWERVVAGYTHDLLKALEYIHARCVVHRDIKLENLMLVRKRDIRGPVGIREEYKENNAVHLKLIDFGLSKRLENFHERVGKMSTLRPLLSSTSKVTNVPTSLGAISTLSLSLFPQEAITTVVRKPIIDSSPVLHTYEGVEGLPNAASVSRVPNSIRSLKTCCGSPNYMAPEILRASRRHGAIIPSRHTGYGKEVDMWAAGVALFVMLYGHYPFRGERSSVSCKKILRGQYTIPSNPYIAKGCTPVRGSTVPPTEMPGSNIGCEDLLKKLLCVDPNERITAVDALAHPWIVGHTSESHSPVNVAKLK